MVPGSLAFKLIWVSCGIVAKWQITSAMRRRLQEPATGAAFAPSPLGSFGPMGREVVRIGGASLGDQGSGLGAMIIVGSKLSRRPLSQRLPLGAVPASAAIAPFGLRRPWWRGVRGDISVCAGGWGCHMYITWNLSMPWAVGVLGSP